MKKRLQTRSGPRSRNRLEPAIQELEERKCQLESELARLRKSLLAGEDSPVLKSETEAPHWAQIRAEVSRVLRTQRR